MSPALRELRLLLDDFVAGAPFWPFWNAFMDHAAAFRPERELSPAGLRAYEELVARVEGSAPDPVPEADRAAGVLGAAELRAQLRGVRLEAADGRTV